MALQTSPDLAPIAQISDDAYVAEKWNDARSYLSAFYTTCKEHLEFSIDQAHWNDESTDPQLTQPTDVALMNLMRHQVSEVTKAGRYFQAHPIDNVIDPRAAEVAKNALEQNINDIESCFDEVQEDWIIGGIAAGMWFVYTYYDETDEEVRDCDLPLWRVGWTPGYKYPWRAPWMTVEFDMLPSEIRAKKGWQNTKDVISDSEHQDPQSAGQGANQVFAGNNAQPSPGTTTTRYTKVVFLYEKGVSEKKSKQIGFTTLPKEETRLHCSNQTCNYRSAPESDYPDVDLPDVALCPDCMSTMFKLTLKPEFEEVEVFPDGKRLTISAVNQGKTFYKGRWPDNNRNFPLSSYSGYSHPTKPVPPSETHYYRSLACISDAMLRLGYQQQRKAHGIILAPQDSLFDAYGQDFAFSEHQDVAYYDPDSAFHAQAIQWFQPQGLNSAWATYFNSVQSIFIRNQGPFATGLGPSESKDIAVGTIRTLVETGNIPMDHKIRRFQRAKSRWLTRRWEIMRSRYTKRRWVKMLGPAGIEAMEFARMSALPAYDVIVTAEPKISQQEIDQAKSLVEIVRSVPEPWLRRVMFRAAGVAPSLVQEIEREEAKAAVAAAEKAAADAAAAARLQAPPVNPGLPPALMARMAGLAAPNGVAA